MEAAGEPAADDRHDHATGRLVVDDLLVEADEDAVPRREHRHDLVVDDAAADVEDVDLGVEAGPAEVGDSHPADVVGPDLRLVGVVVREDREHERPVQEPGELELGHHGLVVDAAETDRLGAVLHLEEVGVLVIPGVEEAVGGVVRPVGLEDPPVDGVEELGGQLDGHVARHGDAQVALAGEADAHDVHGVPRQVDDVVVAFEYRDELGIAAVRIEDPDAAVVAEERLGGQGEDGEDLVQGVELGLHGLSPYDCSSLER